LKWSAKPRIVGPWRGDPTCVTGSLWLPSTSYLSFLHNSSQIAVPAGGPSMRGGLRPCSARVHAERARSGLSLHFSRMTA
jgi:hypothetical protein